MSAINELKLKNRSEKVKPGQIPKKRTINLVQKNKKAIKLSVLIPGIVVILLLAAAFSKFAVIDRLSAANQAQAKAAQLQKAVEEAEKRMQELGDVKSEYAHFTWSGFTPDELAAANKVEVLNLIKSKVMDAAVVKNWSLSGNQLYIQMCCQTLSEINAIAASLEQDPLVGFCAVVTASANPSVSQDAEGMVTAQVTVVLRSPEEVMAIRGDK